MNSAVSFVKVGNRYINPQQIAFMDKITSKATQIHMAVRDSAGYQETVFLAKPIEELAQKIATSKEPILDLTG